MSPPVSCSDESEEGAMEGGVNEALETQQSQGYDRYILYIAKASGQWSANNPTD